MRANYLLPLLVMMFLAGLTLWLRQAVESPPQLARSDSSHTPDAIVENFTMHRLSIEGKPQYSISARRMAHYPDNNITELIRPDFLRRGNDGDVTIVADRGSLSQDGSEAAFYGHVVIRQQTRDEPDLVARSEYVQILAEKDLIRSNRAVTIHQGTSSLTGIGMEIHRRTRQFSIASQVKGQYSAQNRK